MAGYRAKPPHGATLNRADPLTRGLVAAWMLGERSGPAVYDLAGGARNKLSFSGSLAWGKTPFGPGVSAATSTDRLTAAAPVLTTATLTIAGLVRSTNVGFNTATIFNNISGGQGYSLESDGNSTPKWRINKNNSTSVVSDNAFVNNVWYLVVGSVDYNGLLSLWVNGVKQSGSATNAATPSATANAVVAQGGSSRPLDTAFVACWNRGLTPAEQVALAADPFRVFRRRRVPVPLRPAGGGPSPITGDASITLGALTSSAAGAVAIAGASAVTLGAATLSAAGAVALSGAAATTLGSLSLVAAGTVAVAGSAAVTLDSLTAAAAGAVALSGTATLTLGSVVLSADGTLTDGPTGSASITLGALALSATGGVAVSGSAAASLGSATLTADGLVAIAGAVAVAISPLTLTAVGGSGVNAGPARRYTVRGQYTAARAIPGSYTAARTLPAADLGGS